MEEIVRRFTGRRVLAVAGVALAVGAAGCGSSNDNSGSSATASGGGSTSSPKASNNKKPVKIAIVKTFNAVPFYQNAELGIKAAAADESADVKVAAPVQATASGAANAAQNLDASLKPDGFGVNPCILSGWIQIMNQLVRTVPNSNVMAWNCKPGTDLASVEKSPVKTFVGPADAESGYMAAKTAIKAAGLGPDTTGTALLAYCLPGVPILEGQRVGLSNAVKELLPKVKQVLFTSKVDNAGALAAWTSKLTNSSNVVYAMGVCDQDAYALSTLKARGSIKDIPISVIDPTATMLQQIKRGEIAGAAAMQPWVIGNVVTRLLTASARGAQKPVGWVDTGVGIITKENADQWLDATKSPAQAKAFFGPKADEVINNLKAQTKPMAESFATSFR
jgi:ABC-type sugar transport system substrate-binding protein